MRSFIAWISTIVCLLAIIATLGFVKYSQVQAAIAFGESFPEPSETVEVMKTSQIDYRDVVTLIGEIRATRTLEVRNELEGQITDVSFVSGGAVEAGQLLVQLDISTEKAQLDAINAQLKLSNLEVKRFKNLIKSNAGAQEQLDRALSQVAILQANAKETQATIDRKTIRAPFNATAGLHQWEKGGFLAANSLVTTLVGNLDEVWVDFRVPQQYSSVSVGDAIEVTTSSSQSSRLTGKIVAIDQQLDANSRSLLARALIDNREAKLKPNASVSVILPISQLNAVVPIPDEALRFDAQGSYVFAIDKKDSGEFRARKMPVRFAYRASDQVMIVDGLQGNEMIATVGSAKLSPEMLVNIANEP